MHLKKILLLFLALSTFAFADEASHRKAAGDLVGLVASPAMVRAGFSASMNGMLEAMKRNGAPDGAIVEMRAAVDDWLNKEIVWDELKGQITELYVREFSEQEINQILAFYHTPTGEKMLSKMPSLMQDGARIGQAYAASKQESLKTRIQAIAQKYNLK